MLPLFLNIHEGTTDEFKRAVAPYEPMVKQLADAGCDLIHPEGAPPFMLLGFKGEAAQIKKWEKNYKVPFFTSGSNHVRALRALKAKRIVGATYFVGGSTTCSRIISSRPASTCSAWKASRCRSTRSASSRRKRSTPTSSASSSSTARPTRSICSAPAGACCR